MGPLYAYSVSWTARASGADIVPAQAPVSSGVYLYRLKTADFEDTKRMVLLK